jgi:hypothetical protein
LEQDASNQTIEITFVRNDHFGSGQGATHNLERNQTIRRWRARKLRRDTILLQSARKIEQPSADEFC